MPKDDAWDWPLLLYVGTVILNRTEGAFWRMTPRKLKALAAIHVELNSSDPKKKKEQKQKAYIDQVF